MKLCLRLSNCLFVSMLLLFSCSNPYKNLAVKDNAANSAMRFRPVFEKELYRCIVDGRFLFKKFHLSGLLFLKKMEDSSTRVIFQNEMGLSFFDFEWDKEDNFKVNQIIPQLDKPVVVQLLQKDMQLLLMNHLYIETEQHFIKDAENYDRFNLDKGYAYYISQQNRLNRIENVGKRKVITIQLGEKSMLNDLPQTVVFTHHKANFTIRLTKIDTHADE